VDSRRAIDEVVNLVRRGWAPIVTDERKNNTDGSHRGIAARVWSLLKYLDTHFKEATEPVDVNELISEFIASRTDMQGLTLRETLRVTQELLINPVYEPQRQIIYEALPLYPDIKFIPVLLLPEKEALCVVKNPFDTKGEVIGVDPFVTYTLTDGRSHYALGSRGPYHRTDRTPAPWFDIWELQP
jgi:hypothetical protein